jgi:hypothetical protein
MKTYTILYFHCEQLSVCLSYHKNSVLVDFLGMLNVHMLVHTYISRVSSFGEKQT